MLFITRSRRESSLSYERSCLGELATRLILKGGDWRRVSHLVVARVVALAPRHSTAQAIVGVALLSGGHGRRAQPLQQQLRHGGGGSQLPPCGMDASGMCTIRHQLARARLFSDVRALTEPASMSARSLEAFRVASRLASLASEFHRFV